MNGQMMDESGINARLADLATVIRLQRTHAEPPLTCGRSLAFGAQRSTGFIGHGRLGRPLADHRQRYNNSPTTSVGELRVAQPFSWWAV